MTSTRAARRGALALMLAAAMIGVASGPGGAAARQRGFVVHADTLRAPDARFRASARTGSTTVVLAQGASLSSISICAESVHGRRSSGLILSGGGAVSLVPGTSITFGTLSGTDPSEGHLVVLGGEVPTQSAFRGDLLYLEPVNGPLSLDSTTIEARRIVIPHLSVRGLDMRVISRARSADVCE